MVSRKQHADKRQYKGKQKKHTAAFLCCAFLLLIQVCLQKSLQNEAKLFCLIFFFFYPVKDPTICSIFIMSKRKKRKERTKQKNVTKKKKQDNEKTQFHISGSFVALTCKHFIPLFFHFSIYLPPRKLVITRCNSKLWTWMMNKTAYRKT